MQKQTNPKTKQIEQKCVFHFDTLNHNYPVCPIQAIIVFRGASLPPQHLTEQLCFRELFRAIHVFCSGLRQKLCGLHEEIVALICCAVRYLSSITTKYWDFEGSVVWETPQDLRKAWMLLNVHSGIQQQTEHFHFFWSEEHFSCSSQQSCGLCSSCDALRCAVQAVNIQNK